MNLLILFCAMATSSFAQNTAQLVSSNICGAKYPQIIPDSRAIFKIKAPDVQKLQIGLGKKYDMVKINDTDGSNKTVRGFKKVEVAAGKTGKVTTELPPSAFEFYDHTQNKMSIISGEYEVFYGTSSDSNELKMTRITIL